ncbi:adhesin-like protein [Methanobrevibacter ruminantium M1]|uniref:Adhesin-like protein n=1 Tax=Methanobrevibacter ruminantium (strain ATCC 35063 / DSM 1093 / JCM 13430 / OCM 146 / M1) TaxID=634498 RepID=D3E0T5_METRM|nr:Ig-like domain-containing protein [Methanobrevibacter ruminantium]ADC47909.1 adhesin-like protein [Methanobrevibacter ruminantium M1]
MKVYKMILISLILVILSISCVSANDLTNDAIQGDLSDIDYSFTIDDDLSNSDNSLDVSSDLKENSCLDEIDLDKESNQNTTKILSSNQLDSNLLDSNQLESDQLSSNQLDSSLLNSNQLNLSNTYTVSQSTYSKYFDKNGYVKTSVVAPYDTIDLSGNIISKNFIFTIPCHITSSNNAKLTNCMIKFENMTADGRSSVSNLYIRNSVEWCPGVFLEGSTNVDVYGNDIYCTGANGNPVRVIYSNYSNIFGNKLETYFTGYMNLSWKRAGILLGDSHYNNIFSNDVTIKDSNPIYLTTYGFEKSNHNTIYNNTVRSSAISEDSGLSNPSAWAYGIHLMGDYNIALNNTIHNVYRGIDSEGSFNILAGNIIFNLTGGYFEGNDGTEGGDYGIHASYDNIVANNTIFNSKLTGSAIYLMPNNTAYGNIVYNISGHNGLEFNYYADNCKVYNNIIDVPVESPIYVFGRMNNLLIENNILTSVDSSSILVKKQSNSKYPTDVTIRNNLIMGYSKTFNQSPIDYSQIKSDANIISFNNSIAVYNDTYFNYFAEIGNVRDYSDWIDLNNTINYSDSYNYNALVFVGNFSSITDNITKTDYIIPLKDIVNSRISDVYRNVPYNEYKSMMETLNEIYTDIVFNGPSPVDLRGVDSGGNSSDSNQTPMDGNGSMNESSDNGSDNSTNSSLDNLDDEVKDSYENLIDNINSTENASDVYVINDANYALYFNEDGSFRDDFPIEFGNTLRFANLTNKMFKIDIPLKIISDSEDSSLLNCFISLEGESSNTIISNLKFELDNLSSNIDFISIKDGVSNVLIYNNTFKLDIDSSDSLIDSPLSDDASLSAIRLYGSDYISRNIFIENNIIDFKSNFGQLYGIYLSNKMDYLNSKTNPSGFIIRNNVFSIDSNGLINAIYSDSVKNLLLENNLFNLSSNGNLEDSSLIYGLDLVKVDNLTMINNQFSINSTYLACGINSSDSSGFNLSNNQFSVDSAYLAYGLNLKNTNNFNLHNNDFYIDSGSFAHALDLDDCNNFNIANNLINASGADIKRNLNASNLAVFIQDDLNDNVLKNGYLYISELNGSLKGNGLYENDFKSPIVHTDNSTRDLQNLIDFAVEGDTVELGNMVFADLDTINIYKNLTINGGIFVSGNWRPLFHILPNDELLNHSSSDSYNSYRSFDYLNIQNGAYYLDNADLLILAEACNGTDSLSIQVPSLNICDNEFMLLDDSTVAESINILKLLSSRAILAPTNDISIENNILVSGMNPFVFEVSSIMTGSDIDIAHGPLNPKKASKIIFEDMVTTAFDSNVEGRIGKYFEVTLKDENGNALSNKAIQIGFNGRIYNRTTDENGSASLQINLAYKGTYTFAISFLGDEYYNGSFEVAKITVKKQTPKLDVSNVTYKSSAKSKTWTAKLTTSYGSLLKNKKVYITIDGKTYTTRTNSKGIASLKVSLSTKKTYKFTVKFEGDDTYNSLTKTAKLTIK